MRIARIFGTVTLNRAHPAFRGASLRLAAPLSLANLTGESQDEGETLVVWDQLGAGNGSLIALSEGVEAAMPFRPEVKPVDAYCAALLDEVHVRKP